MPIHSVPLSKGNILMDAIEYYKTVFGKELMRIQNATKATIKDRISIVSFIPTKDFTRPFGDHAKAFDETLSKRLFLFCFFFSALIDQAIHSSLRDEHYYFDNIAKYPKFAGLLGTYLSNLHPVLLLLIATLYISSEEEDAATSEFQLLADFFSLDYCRFLCDVYPKLTGRLKGEKEQRNACRAILSEISNAMALLFIPQSLRPYSALKPKKHLYERWVLYFSKKINKRLKEYE
jgi:hypothetical protein